MKRCKTCVETTSRPTSSFDDDGICLPCKSVSSTSKAIIDWEYRATQLKEVVEWGKKNSSSTYDCVIGVSGGKDSTRQAIFARENGLNPLLVCCSYPPEQVTVVGQENLENLVNLGFDLINVTPAPLTSKELMINCLRTYGNLFNASELALYSTLPIIATSYKIPLILLGENPSLAFGTDVGSNDYNGNNMKHMNTLKGGDPHQFKTEEMTDKELYWYRYPSDENMQKANIQIVYLGYFIDDFNEQANFDFSTKYGLKTRIGEDAKPENIGGITSYTALDDDFVFVNQMIKFIKFGFGKATQEVGVAVRNNRMTRAEGLRLVKQYDGKCNQKYINKLSKYLNISTEELWSIIEEYRNKDIFYKNSENEWQLKEEFYV